MLIIEAKLRLRGSEKKTVTLLENKISTSIKLMFVCQRDACDVIQTGHLCR